MPQALPHPASSPRGQYDTRGEDEHRSAPQRLLEERRVSTEALHIQKEIVRLKKKAAFQPEPSPNQSEVAPPKEPTNMPASDCNTPPDLTSDSPPRPAGDGPPKAPRQYIRRCRDGSLKSGCVVVCVNRINFSNQLDYSITFIVWRFFNSSALLPLAIASSSDSLRQGHHMQATL